MSAITCSFVRMVTSWGFFPSRDRYRKFLSACSPPTGRLLLRPCCIFLASPFALRAFTFASPSAFRLSVPCFLRSCGVPRFPLHFPGHNHGHPSRRPAAGSTSRSRLPYWFRSWGCGAHLAAAGQSGRGTCLSVVRRGRASEALLETAVTLDSSGTGRTRWPRGRVARRQSSNIGIRRVSRNRARVTTVPRWFLAGSFRPGFGPERPRDPQLVSQVSGAGAARDPQVPSKGRSVDWRRARPTGSTVP